MRSCIHLIILTVVLFSCSSAPTAPKPSPVLQPGDLIFQDLDCGPLCESIERVTAGYLGRPVTHVGLVVASGDTLAVLEATGEAVQLTGLDQFVSRNAGSNGKPKAMAGRLREEWQPLVKPAVSYAIDRLGEPYDDAFLPDNGKWYCSELIEEAFRMANGGTPVFDRAPMTFRDPGTKEEFQAWTTYYAEMGIAVPEGVMGCNPGGLSRSTRLVMVHDFGGWNP